MMYSQHVFPRALDWPVEFYNFKEYGAGNVIYVNVDMKFELNAKDTYTVNAAVFDNSYELAIINGDLLDFPTA